MNRRNQAKEHRQIAAQIANDRPHPAHINNGDEQKFRHEADKDFKPSFLMSYTKGIPHNYVTGLIEEPNNFQLFVRAIDSGDFRDFRDTPLGHDDNCLGGVCAPGEFGWKSNKAKTGDKGGPVNVRAWESQSAGNSYEMEGPDAQAVTMPPAPRLGSEELTAEMAEIYAQALLRDTPFNGMTTGVMGIGPSKTKDDISTDQTLTTLDTKVSVVTKFNKYANMLNGLAWFNNANLNLSLEEAARRRNFKITPANMFRGITRGDDIGPYLSQFLLAGNSGINKNDPERNPANGLISFGANTIDQRVRVATQEDHLTDWDEWFDAQNGADLRGMEGYQASPARRFIYTPRDLATYVHYDALYQAYLNACLIMLSINVPFDPGVPFQEADNRDHQQGFAHFGGPHILSLVTEVATRALKAVRFQKFNVHRRCRPEVLAARLYKWNDLKNMAPELAEMKNDLDSIGLLADVNAKNGGANNYLLPMAFCEGSPMHPAYGAGHATVAGACVTILKAFFDHKHPLRVVPFNVPTDAPANVRALLTSQQPGINIDSSNLAYVSTDQGTKLEIVPVFDGNCKPARLTVEGELNKLASNIAIGRNWAGVHYFTDYYESLLLGERIALGILEEQKLTYNENFSMTVPLFNGDTIRI